MNMLEKIEDLRPVLTELLTKRVVIRFIRTMNRIEIEAGIAFPTDPASLGGLEVHRARYLKLKGYASVRTYLPWKPAEDWLGVWMLPLSSRCEPAVCGSQILVADRRADSDRDTWDTTETLDLEALVDLAGMRDIMASRLPDRALDGAEECFVFVDRLSGVINERMAEIHKGARSIASLARI